MKRLFGMTALVLCLCTLLSLLAACGGENGKTTTAGSVTTAGGTVTTAGGTVTTAGGTTAGAVTTTGGKGDGFRYDEDGYVLDNVPDNVDYRDRLFTPLIWTQGLNWQFPTEESQNDVIQSEVYNRTLAMESRLSCHFAPDTAPAAMTDMDTFLSKASKAGDEKKDFIITYSLWPAVLAQKEILHNLKSLNFPQMEMPWWPVNMSEWTQYGTLFFCSNSVSATNINNKIVLFVDTQAVAEKGLDDVLDFVLDYEWTVDKFATYVAAFHDDAIAAKTAGTTYYGLVVDDYSRLDAFYYGAGCSSTKNNNKGIARFAFISSSDVSRITTVADKFISIMQPEECYIGQDNLSFMKSKSTAFQIAHLGSLFSTNDDYPYAPVPEPMWDEAQGRYCVVSNNAYECMCIPIGAVDPEASGVVLETISSLDYRMVAPIFFEDKLKNRYARSEAGQEIYDILLASAYIDFGRVSQIAFTSVEPSWRAIFADKGENRKTMNNNFASKVASLNQGRQLENRLNEQLAIYKKYGSK